MSPASIQIVLTVSLEVRGIFVSTLSLVKNKIKVLFPSQAESLSGVRFDVLLVPGNGVARAGFLQHLLQLRFPVP